jgi:hypothetical protein
MDATHLEALAQTYEAALSEIAQAAQAAHARVDGDLQALSQLNGTSGRPPLIPDVPVDEPPPYIPPPMSSSPNALIPDTPLVDSPIASSSLAFDDAPLWQS